MLSTQQGGRVIIDPLMLKLWQAADGHTHDETLANAEFSGLHKQYVSAALKCLRQAGLLTCKEDEYYTERRGDHASLKPAEPESEHANHLVSVIIVSYNSQAWLEVCLPSLLAQAYSPLEIIIVDNGSQDGSAGWAAENYPSLQLIRLEQPCALAKAMNLGIHQASGEYYLLLNPDVTLEPDAIGQIVAVAQNDPACAAVAAKLKLLWAPAFLNGLGNYVGAFSWGADSALGHLDLGQFDSWDEISSACFAATLIPTSAWKAVGPLDEDFPMYYEDSEWCYRARLLGYPVHAAPQAVIYHALGGRTAGGNAAESALPARKLRHVVYGRLRFVTKLLSPAFLVHFLFNYILEDMLRCSLALVRGRWALLGAYRQAWKTYIQSLKPLRQERKIIQERRQCTDQELFRVQQKVPIPLVRNGLPLLTWDIVCNHYYPLLCSDAVRSTAQPLWRRAAKIWRLEGLSALLHRLGKQIGAYLAQP